jgi:signal transduction histidine kinase
MNGVLGMTELILVSELNPKQKHFAETIRDSADSLLDIINDILDISKIGADKLQLDEQEIDVRDIVDTCIAIVNERAERDQVALTRRIDEHLPALFADARRFKQIMLNLLSNAIKFSRQGGHVSVSAEIGPGGAMTVCVSDGGVGMTADEIQVALSLFGQVDSQLARSHEGTGLGLPLTNALVELHDGRLLIESEPGAGTVVTIHFPAERVRGDEADARQAASA